MTDDERLALGLSKGRPHTRRAALRRLGERRDDAAVDLLLRVASNHEDPLRGDAAKELGRAGSSRVVLPLTQILEGLWEEGDEDLGDAIASALREIGDPAAIPALEDVLEQRMDDGFFFFTHREALFALADFGRVEPVEAFLADQSRDRHLREEVRDFILPRAQARAREAEQHDR